eukprot:superscaffoldBa00000033_g621
MVIDGRGYDRASGPMHTAPQGSMLAPQHQLGSAIPLYTFTFSFASSSETHATAADNLLAALPGSEPPVCREME